jgi:hypothetical protein
MTKTSATMLRPHMACLFRPFYWPDGRVRRDAPDAFRQALQQLGWSGGGNVRIETRVAKGNPKRLRIDSA